MSSLELSGRHAGQRWSAYPQLSRAVALAAGLLAGAALGLLMVAVLSLRLLGFQALTVASDSMSPALATGDLIIVKPVNIANVEPGDIVLFTSGGERIPTVHRVLGLNEYETIVRDGSGGESARYVDYRLVTGGDANPAPDAREVSAEQLVGTVWFTVPGGGALGGLPMKTLFAGFTIAVIALWVSWEIHGHRKQQARWNVGALLILGVASLASTASWLPHSTALAWTAPAGIERGAAMVMQMKDRPNPTVPPGDPRPIVEEPAAFIEPSRPSDPAGVDVNVDGLSDFAPDSEVPVADPGEATKDARPVAEHPNTTERPQTRETIAPTRTPENEVQETRPVRR